VKKLAFVYLNGEKNVGRGAGYMASVILDAGYDLDFFDTVYISLQEVSYKIAKGDYGILLISSSTLFYKQAVELSKLVKSAINIPILLGGAHSTILREKILKECNEIDYICVGEGEEFILDFLKNYGTDKLFTVKNLGYRIHLTGEEITLNSIRECTDLSKLPKFRYDLFLPQSVVLNSPLPGFCYVFSTRGCPYNCSYCLDGDTIISISNGGNKKIKDIKIGDKVMSFDETKNKLVENIVIDTMKRKVDDILTVEMEEGNKLTITSNHEVYTPNGWLEIGKLKIGDEILLIDYKDKISFQKTYYNPAKYPEVRKKISKTLLLQSIKLSKRLKLRWDNGTMKVSKMSSRAKKKLSNLMKNNNPMKNKTTADKVSKTLIEKYKNEIHPNKSRKRPDFSNYLLKHNPMKDPIIANNPERIKKISLSLGGTGIPYELREYPSIFSNDLKEKIRERDDRKCQLCGKLEYHCENKLTIHHIDYDKKNNKECNLITLCVGCNTKVNTKRDYWESYFKEKMLKYQNCPHFVKIKSIYKKSGETMVYNFECEHNNNYFANYMLVHNCCNSYYLSMYKKGFLRKRSVNSVIDELKYLKENYPVKIFYFGDEMILFDKDYVTELFTRVKDEIGLPYGCMARVENVNTEIVELFKSTGCRYVGMGIECGDEQFRKEFLNRHMSNEKIIEAFRMLRTIPNIMLTSYNMRGYPVPYDDRLLLETKKLNDVVKPDIMQVSLFFPFPGTKLYDYCVENDLIDYSKLNGVTDYFAQSVLKVKNNVVSK